MDWKEIMEMNVFWDIVKVVVGSTLGIIVTALLPFIVQLRREKEEKDKIKADTSDVSAEAVKKIVTAAGDLQEGYQEFIDEMKARATEYREEITSLSGRVRELEKSNLELKHMVEESNSIIIELSEGIKILSTQIKALNHTPVWEVRRGE
jgi:uncharacterized coiled-coil DUF342 family protein